LGLRTKRRTRSAGYHRDHSLALAGVLTQDAPTIIWSQIVQFNSGVRG
jgi:hypothetical protein